MEGLRISVLLVVSFGMGLVTWAFLGSSPTSNTETTNHLSALTTCPVCNNDCAPTFFSSR